MGLGYFWRKGKGMRQNSEIGFKREGGRGKTLEIGLKLHDPELVYGNHFSNFSLLSI